MSDNLAELGQLARDTITWIENRLVKMQGVRTLPAVLASQLARPFRLLLKPCYVLPGSDKPLLVDVRFADWPDDYSDGHSALQAAICRDEGSHWWDERMVAERLSRDPNAVAEVLTALRLIAMGYDEMRACLLPTVVRDTD